MAQWEIISGVYSKLSESIKKIKTGEVEAGLYIKDICQCMFDKSGQQIIVDEKMYEQPAIYEICLGIKIQGKDISDVLKTYGQIAVYMKDNPSISIEEWKWHGSSSDKVYFEPVIRHADLSKSSFENGVHSFELLYKTEISLNSQKSSEFKRVEKREIRGYVKDSN